jgi:putative nucleotidyltransferase with HDIG domain
MMDGSAADLVGRVKSVVTLPAIFTRIDNLINDPRSDLIDIADVISEDPGLSVRLLKIANSAMYSFPSEIDSITRAITMIGTRQLRDLVLATKVMQVFDSIDANVVDMTAFWKHSIATGIMARILATYRREPNVEYFYLLGLLHDVGRLIMYMEIPELAIQTVEHSKTNNILLHQAEIALLGYDHAVVGAELLSSWNLPESMHDALRYHHRPSLSLNYCLDTTLVHVADLIVNALNHGCISEGVVPQLDEQAWDKLELSPNILKNAVELMDQQFEAAVNLFLEVD